MKFVICFHYKRLFIINNSLKFDYLKYFHRFRINLYFFITIILIKTSFEIIICDNALIYYNFKLIRLYCNAKFLLNCFFIFI